jgi:hypothetical protein
MSNELSGTAIVLNNTTGAIVGQGDFSHTFGGTPIEIGNKSFGDNITYLDGELSGKQHIFSGDFTYNNDTEFRKVRADAFSGTQDTYTLTFINSGTDTDESFTGLFVPTGLSDSIPHGAKVTMSLSFNSSGEVVIVPATDL